VENRERKIPIEIQQQAVDLDEKMSGVVTAPVVGPWQQQLNELGGAKPLAFGQYGEPGPGFEQAGGGGYGRSDQAVPHPQQTA
jgi:hypothetical protein